MARYLVTSALPYANGPIHFGHAAGAYLPADLYVRTLRMLGEDVLYVCGTDEHGVAITLKAEQEGAEFPEYVARWREEILATFTQLGIEFDVFSGTNRSPSHAETSQEFFLQLDKSGYLKRRDTEQLYCAKDDIFLADRYVLGTCYVCGNESARGDECPQCGTWIDALRLVSPSCKLCGSAPERRSTTHWYLDLPKLRDEHIGEWIAKHDWKPNVKAFILNMLKDVPERAITRDMRWGIPVPDSVEGDTDGKVLYVWFDAPIGYISFTKDLMAERGTPDAWRDWWQSADTRLVHFIGKDNIPFHCMVFPSMLHGVKQDYVLPWAVPANEFYNLAGGKFSTSEGNTFDTAEFMQHYGAEVTRFYILCTLPETADAEFNPEQLVLLNNASLSGNLGNLITRVLKFTVKNFDGRLPDLDPAHAAEYDAQLLGGDCGEVVDPAASIREHQFRRAAEQLLANATVANVFMQRTEPWALRKTDPARAASALATLVQYLHYLARWMAPFLPSKAQELWVMLGCEGEVSKQAWPSVPQAGEWRELPESHVLGTPEALFPRLELAAEPSA
ncbi:MAG: methionyl-tRNA synthetase [Planctomycetota bacterium]